MLRSKCINKDRKQKNHSGFSVFLLYGLEYSPNFTSGVTTVFNNDRDNSAGLGVGSDQEYAETAGGKSIPVDGVSARYVRLYTNGSTANIYNHYVEVEVMVPGSGGSGSDPGDPPDDPPDDPPVPGTNVALGKSVTSSIGQLGTVMTDGDKNTYNYQGVHEGLQWVQIDLGQIHTINMIKIWHYFGDGRKYRDVIVRASNSSNFSSGVVTLFNNDKDNSAGFGTGNNDEYAETSDGKTIVFTPVNARYVRLYSNGSDANIYNHYVEVEVYTADD